MMFNKLSALVSILALPILAVATPWGAPTTTSTPATTTTVTVTATSTATPASSCDTGPVQCCDSTESSSSAAGSLLLALLGIVVQGATVPIGLTCSPITAIGVGGTSCNAQTVCCQNNNFNGVVAIGCTPVNLAL